MRQGPPRGGNANAPGNLAKIYLNCLFHKIHHWVPWKAIPKAQDFLTGTHINFFTCSLSTVFPLLVLLGCGTLLLLLLLLLRLLLLLLDLDLHLASSCKKRKLNNVSKVTFLWARFPSIAMGFSPPTFKKTVRRITYALGKGQF